MSTTQNRHTGPAGWTESHFECQNGTWSGTTLCTLHPHTTTATTLHNNTNPQSWYNLNLSFVHEDVVRAMQRCALTHSGCNTSVIQVLFVQKVSQKLQCAWYVYRSMWTSISSCNIQCKRYKQIHVAILITVNAQCDLSKV